MPQQRRFSRINMDGTVELKCGGQSYPSELLDISLRGALISRPSGWQSESGEDCTLQLGLGPDIHIEMQGDIVHSEADHLGLRCDHIDLDSISHLRRLIELNLGDEEQLERELSELYHDS